MKQKKDSSVEMTEPNCEEALSIRAEFYIEKVIRGFVGKTTRISFVRS